MTIQPVADAATTSAVVADPDRKRLARTTSTLESAGFSVASTPDEGELLRLLARGHPSVLIVHMAFSRAVPAGTAAADASGSITGAAPQEEEPGIPVLFLVDEDHDLSPDVLEMLSVSDYVRTSARADELIHRVQNLIRRGQRRSEVRGNSERLRQRLRGVSAAIRATNDPRNMSEQFVQGFGETFDADHVWFTTFDDERVPLITAQWNRYGLAQLPPRLGAHEPAARRAANRFWTESALLTVDDHLHYRPSPEDGELLDWMEAMGARASAVVPVGEGEAAFGILWIVNAHEPRLWTVAETALIRHVAGNLAYGLIQGHLINAQQLVLKRLHQLDQAKTDFLAMVNHELRTPLTSITAYLDMIHDGEGGPVPPGIEEMLTVIEQNSDRLRGLIEDMLSFARHDNSDDSRKAPVNIGHLLRMVTAVLRPMSTARDIHITLDHAGEDLVVGANEAQLERVFTNLVSNAIKFTPRGGHVSITAQKCGSEDQAAELRVEVADDGIGIPEHDIPQVFQRFFRASNASAAAVPGTGLGLAIVHDIITRHNGSIAVASALGRGTTFSVRLPLDSNRAAPGRTEPFQEAVAPGVIR
ncbi:ATP-binding protein [Arthrobacter sp. PsM3]|uniref:ATP-binding protein n=1 Tax=Arthrobacter sp. PsM3 TaxID=3030531 RepID=UPI00263AABBB|nr:ATP-binding protein [Arthrobacter sp. PsM3]MDN4645117.1 ATP-binding protein [Arthrobacter sp. PsM3]